MHMLNIHFKSAWLGRAFLTLMACAIHVPAESTAQAAAVEPSFRERIQPVKPGTGFRMAGYFVWCGSVIKADNAYHLFAARWPAATGFPEGYRKYSEIVRAASATPEGPYVFQEVVIGRRAAGQWDSGMAHNPAIYRVGNLFVLFYIGSDIGSAYRQIGYATAPTISGPWTRSAQPLDLGCATDANNPAACFEPDGSLKLLWRTKDLKVCISTAPAYGGPYQLSNSNVWPAARLEDFFFFKQHGTWQIMCEDNAGKVTGHFRWGVQLWSADGVHAWKPCTPPIAYDHTIAWTDGTAFHPVRRERPWLLVEDGQATQLFTAVFDGTNTWNQPVPIQPPYPVDP